MTTHRTRFDGRAADYTRYRMRFTTEVLELLRELCGLEPGYVIADVGAGTGMSAEMFLEAGHQVFAVEPNAEMRAECERVHGHHAGLTVCDATAEETGLADASIDMVVVGRAFHWFDRDRALAEFARILKPGGWVALLTSRRSADASPKAREYEAVLLEHGTSYGEVRQSYLRFSDLRPYGDAGRVQVEFPGVQTLSREAFFGQTRSLSVTPLPGHPKHEGMQAALAAFFDKWAVDGVLELETITEVLAWKTQG